MARAIRCILKTHVAEHRNNGPLAQGRHGERQISLGDTELAKGIDDRHEAHLTQASAGADHVGLGNTHFNGTAVYRFLKC